MVLYYGEEYSTDITGLSISKIVVTSNPIDIYIGSPINVDIYVKNDSSTYKFFVMHMKLFKEYDGFIGGINSSHNYIKERNGETIIIHQSFVVLGNFPSGIYSIGVAILPPFGEISQFDDQNLIKVMTDEFIVLPEKPKAPAELIVKQFDANNLIQYPENERVINSYIDHQLTIENIGEIDSTCKIKYTYKTSIDAEPSPNVYSSDYIVIKGGETITFTFGYMYPTSGNLIPMLEIINNTETKTYNFDGTILIHEPAINLSKTTNLILKSDPNKLSTGYPNITFEMGISATGFGKNINKSIDIKIYDYSTNGIHSQKTIQIQFDSETSDLYEFNIGKIDSIGLYKVILSCNDFKTESEMFEIQESSFRIDYNNITFSKETNFYIGGETLINIPVSNTSVISGSCTLILFINNIEYASETITINANSSSSIEFSLIPTVYGEITISCGIIYGSIINPTINDIKTISVYKANGELIFDGDPEIITPPSDWNINNTIQLLVIVKNIGATDKSDVVEMRIDGLTTSSQSFSFGAFSTKEIIFDFTPSKSGNYNIVFMFTSTRKYISFGTISINDDGTTEITETISDTEEENEKTTTVLISSNDEDIEDNKDDNENNITTSTSSTTYKTTTSTPSNKLYSTIESTNNSTPASKTDNSIIIYGLIGMGVLSIGAIAFYITSNKNKTKNIKK